LKPSKDTYYSNGKLLLTGEYLVLDGALSLGVPTKQGQNLVVKPINKPKILWESFDEKGETWFKAILDLPISKNVDSDNVLQTIKNILLQAQKQNPEFLKENKGYNVKTQLGFPREWGLGSSSTLINNIGQWANVDAFELLRKTMGGSGYDIACAQNNQPILYQLINNKPLVQTIDFQPNFREQLYFIYLNKKQRSHKEIKRYQTIKKGIKLAVKTVSEITSLLVKTTSLDDFEILLNEHEQLLSSILQIPMIQKLQFKDYFGQTKSLGAWGGDFILATGNDDTPAYFKKKGFETVLLYNDMLIDDTILR
jgi:mevalonate kinase